MNTPIGKRVLLLGADGFIGRHFAFAFRSMGYDVVCSGRSVRRLHRMGFTTLKADLSKTATHDPDFWRNKLSKVDFVVNAAGLLTGSEARFRAVHVLAPRAIYAALPTHARGVLLSAVGIGSTTKFGQFRREGEEVATTAPIPIVALRAGLVLAETSFGGSSLMRALAVLPFVTPVIAQGDQTFNPIHALDLAKVVHETLNKPDTETCLEVGGPEIVTLKEMLMAYRCWFGLPRARFIEVPKQMAYIVGKLGDFLKLGPISATSVAQLDEGVLACVPAVIAKGAHPPRAFSEFLGARPVGTQDLWHARFYMLRPLVRFSLAILWIVSGFSGLFLSPSAWAPLFSSEMLTEVNLTTAAHAFGLFDLAIGAGLIVLWHPRLLGLLQLAMVTGYTALLSVLAPVMWLDPVGGLLKNLPIVALILVWMVLEAEK